MSVSILYLISLSSILILKLALAKECMPTFVDCHCQSSYQKFIQVPVNTSFQNDEQSEVTSCMADTYAPDVCNDRNCVLIPNENFKILFGKSKKSLNFENLNMKKTFPYKNGNRKDLLEHSDIWTSKYKRSVSKTMQLLIDPYYPQEIVISSGNEFWKRNKRSVEACDIPELDNSEVTCWKWPNWITCNQLCIYGHGLDIGKETVTKTSMNCRYTENVWKPHPVVDCKPYINCKAHLISPGDLNCVQLTKKPSYCEIKCEEYDDMPATDLEKYVCEDKLKLPHCATLDDTVSVVNPPVKPT